ncbi:sodium-solute symporter putative [Candidatus Halobonum tyrrellensis G22]|uniref:Sodium-solute symporter putative n=1 Tax=Candidatus Halobonum tyrrellensis G22 TaxID=1324957 RepID=V4HPU5_9EURY|nr:sodium-solute symporter putative [Candidatus Halobonum tyrrellensis G22]
MSTPVALGATLAALAAVTVLGLVHARGRVGSVEQYVSARDSAGTTTTAATLVASGAGAWILFSPAEAGAAFGGVAAVAGYALGSAVPLLLFVSVGVRVRERLPGGHSLTEYVYARYGRRMYAYALLIAAFYMFVSLAAEMTAVADALGFVAGVPAWVTAGAVGGFVLLYTAYGGLVASIFTDTVQTLVVLPLLAVSVVAAVVGLGGPAEVYGSVAAADPDLLDPTFLPGVAFGTYVVIAITGASVFNQGQWQRVFAAEDDRAVRRGFALAAVVLVPMLLAAGLFGVAAAGLGLLGDASPSAAFFVVVAAALPGWATLGVVVLVVLLMASSADTMVNALASVVTVDLARALDGTDAGTLRLVARGLTVVVTAGAVVVGAQGYGVLELFLLADLLGAATFVPFLHGLYSARATETGALVGSVAGLAVGLAYFPTFHGALTGLPVVGPLLPGASFVHAFVGAAGVSTALSVAGARWGDDRFDLDSLASEVRSLDDPGRGPETEPTPATDGGREVGR